MNTLITISREFGSGERCLWGGDTRKFHTQFGVGIKFIIN